MNRLTKLTLVLVPLVLMVLPAEAEPTRQHQVPLESAVASIGIVPFEMDIDTLQEQRNCAAGCDDCVPRSIHSSNLLGTGFCGNEPDHQCYGWGEICIVCNGVCGGSEFLRIMPFAYIFSINPSTVRSGLEDCLQMKSQVYCNNPNLVYGAYREMPGFDLGFLKGSALDDYGDLDWDPYFQDVMYDAVITPWYLDNEEKAWRYRVGAFAVIVDRLSQPTFERRSGGENVEYYERAFQLCLWLYLYKWGYLHGVYPTDVGFPYHNPLTDSYNFAQLQALEQSTCSYPLLDDCSIVGIEATSWGRIKAGYR